MRLALALLATLALTSFAAGPAAADVTVDGPPVFVCVNGVCTPCPEPVIVATPPDFALTYTGADCN